MRGMRQIVEWAPVHGLSSFTRIFDDDVAYGTPSTDSSNHLYLNWEVYLGSQAYLPCTLTLTGTIPRQHERILCRAEDGCTSITVRNATVQCQKDARALSGPFEVGGSGVILWIVDSSLSDCGSIQDGGSILAYNGASVVINGSLIQRSSSQVTIIDL